MSDHDQLVKALQVTSSILFAVTGNNGVSEATKATVMINGEATTLSIGDALDMADAALSQGEPRDDH